MKVFLLISYCLRASGFFSALQRAHAISNMLCEQYVNLLFTDIIRIMYYVSI